MPRTSTAERYGYVCPLCGEELAEDLDGQGVGPPQDPAGRGRDFWPTRRNGP